MSGWLWVVILNGVTAAAYSGIVLFIVRGLLRTGQFRNNRLAVATAAIFTTCAAHHLIHAWHLTAGLGLTHRISVPIPAWEPWTRCGSRWAGPSM